MINRNSDESKKLIEEIRTAIKTMNSYALDKYFSDLYLKFDENFGEYRWYINNAQLDIGTEVKVADHDYISGWGGVIKSITLKESDDAPAEYIYEVDLGHGYIRNYLASELEPEKMTNKEKWVKMKNGTAKDVRLLEKVGEVINKFKLVDDESNVFKLNECAIGSIAYSIKTIKFDYIVELAYELCEYYHYERCHSIPQEDSIPIARKLMISIYGYEPPLEYE